MVGTPGKDKIIGSSNDEILAGREGGDILKGGSGSDGFLFQNPEGFGKKAAIKIKDYNPDEGDTLLIDKNIFDFGKKINVKTVTGKKASQRASKSNKDYIFNEKKGILFFNEDGKNKGWGEGGLFAKLPGVTELGVDDFTIV